MKKLISLILAFAMVFTLAMPAMAAEDTRTIYFENTGNWSAVYAYALDDSGMYYLTPWPGSAMTKVVGETNIYSIEVSTAATKVIFNSNDNSGTQTADLTIPTDGNDLYSYGTQTWSEYAKKTGDVTASYTPVIAISGVTISEHADYPGAVAVDETNKTYTITIPADQTEVLININVSGQNLDKLPNDSSYLLKWTTSVYVPLSTINYNEENGNLEYIIYARAAHVGSRALMYSTDGGTNWTNTGWTVVVQQAEPAPTAVSLNAKLKAVDSAGAVITGDFMGRLGYGSVDANNVYSTTISTGNHTVTFATGLVPSGYQTPADVSLTVTDTNGDGVGELSSNSSHATVGTETIDGETVYVITVTLEKAEDTPTLPNPLYFKAEGATTVGVFTYKSDDNLAMNDNGEFQFSMTAVEGETGIFSVDTSSFSADTVKVVFSGVGDTTKIDLPTDGSNMYDYDNSKWITYTPSSTEPDTTPAVITGVSLSGTGVTYDETTKTYTVAHDATNIVLTVTGTNLQNGTEDNVVSYANGNSVPVVSRFFTFSGDGTTTTSMMLHVSHFVNSSNYEIKYSNDGQQSWTSAGIYVTYDAGTAATYDVDIAEAENGTVRADKQTAAAGDTVTLTVTPAADYQIGTVTVKDAEGKTVAFTETGVASGIYKFIMPTSNVTVEATFTAIEKTSADIVWGSLAYTYTDEAGEWSAGTAEGAGTVTVTNTGTTAITAAPAYEATTTDYGTITGSFDAASADLAANASKTFTLSLNGTPTKAIPAGTKIGTVTVTITVEVPVSPVAPDLDEEW